MVIIPGVHVIKLGFVNSFLIEEPDSLTLIDCGIPPSGGKITAYIRSIGRQVKDLKKILITHSDTDHVGSLAYLKRLSRAEVYASAVEAGGIRLGKSTKMVKFRGIRRIRSAIISLMAKMAHLEVEHILSDNDVIPVLGGITAIETTGHSPGHMSYYLKSLKILFAGGFDKFPGRQAVRFEPFIYLGRKKGGRGVQKGGYADAGYSLLRAWRGCERRGEKICLRI